MAAQENYLITYKNCYLIFLLGAAFYFSLGCNQTSKTTTHNNLSSAQQILNIDPAPIIDGKMDPSWSKIKWRPMDQKWLGENYTKEDFSGRYKVSWDDNFIYVIAEITDDTLVDTHLDGLDKYWDDDCLEVFIDEDASKGIHQYSHNAFAYHIALDGKVADISPDSIPKYYNHITSKRITSGKLSHWELAIQIFDDSYKDDGNNKPVNLTANKNIGFAIAYCDNDHSVERENFIGSVKVEGEDKNRGWVDAGIFETMTLIKQ